jgi:hypothetical protein
VVFTHTNVGSANNAQFYIHDGTAGIVVFVFGHSIRPRAATR